MLESVHEFSSDGVLDTFFKQTAFMNELVLLEDKSHACFGNTWHLYFFVKRHESSGTASKSLVEVELHRHLAMVSVWRRVLAIKMRLEEIARFVSQTSQPVVEA